MTNTLDDDQMEELKQAFDFFDKDGDGITIDELRDAMRNFGKNPNEEELQTMMEAADADGSGTIDFEEFVVMMTNKLEEQELENELHEAFECFDRDGDGSISCKELRFIMTTLGEKLTDEEVEYMISVIDADGDGSVSYKEFADMMMAKIKI